MIDAIVLEIDHRKDYLQEKHLDSIYFGGGTPSLLDATDLKKIFTKLEEHFTWNSKTEITLEANPDDLNTYNLTSFHKSGINRLSIGIQSFSETDLTYMNRAHNANEARNCISLAQDSGFQNISADLIYGSPTTNDDEWKKNIDTLLSFGIPHISAYALTVEEGTALHHFISTGKTKPVDPDKAVRHFEVLADTLSIAGYDHYEISNFGKPDQYAVHNSNYWKGAAYLGIGPAAHSFNGTNERAWNIAHNAQYIKKINSNTLPFEVETLSKYDLYNEYILIRLRTIWGIDGHDIVSRFPDLRTHFIQAVEKQINQGNIILKDNLYTLSRQGKMLADKVSMELFVD